MSWIALDLPDVISNEPIFDRFSNEERLIALRTMIHDQSAERDFPQGYTEASVFGRLLEEFRAERTDENRFRLLSLGIGGCFPRRLVATIAAQIRGVECSVCGFRSSMRAEEWASNNAKYGRMPFELSGGPQYCLRCRP